METRLDELLRRLESQEHLIRTLQASRTPLTDEQPERDRWTTEAAELSGQQDDSAWRDADDYWSGHGWNISAKHVLSLE